MARNIWLSRTMARDVVIPGTPRRSPLKMAWLELALLELGWVVSLDWTTKTHKFLKKLNNIKILTDFHEINGLLIKKVEMLQLLVILEGPGARK